LLNHFISANFKCPYQANVIKVLERISNPTVINAFIIRKKFGAKLPKSPFRCSLLRRISSSHYSKNKVFNLQQLFYRINHCFVSNGSAAFLKNSCCKAGTTVSAFTNFIISTNCSTVWLIHISPASALASQASPP